MFSSRGTLTFFFALRGDRFKGTSFYGLSHLLHCMFWPCRVGRNPDPFLRRCLVLFHQPVTLSWSTLPNPSLSESKWWGKWSGACIILMPGSCITPVWNKAGCVLAFFLQHMHNEAVLESFCLAISLNLILDLSWDLYLPLVARSLFFSL